MNRRLIKSIAIVSLIVLFAFVLTVASMAKSFWNGLNDSGAIDDEASSSIEESRNYNVFVTTAQISPIQIGRDGISIEFDSAWIERRAKTTPYYIWFHRTSILPGYFLVLRCKSEKNSLNEGDFFLQREDEGHGFAAHGTAIFDEEIDKEDYKRGKTIVYLVKDWKEPRINPIAVTWSVQ